MKRKIIVTIAVIVILGWGVWWWTHRRALKTEEEEIATVKVERGSLVVEVTAPGVLEPLTTVEVKSRSGGEIKRIYVEPGDLVHAGDLIAQLDPTELQNQVDQRAAQVTSARARVEQARYGAQREAVNSKTTLEEAEAGVASARARLRQAESALKLARATSEADVRQAEASLAAARARLKEAERQRDAQPQITETSVAQSRAALKAAEEDLNRLRAGARSQEVVQAEAALQQAQANAANAEKTLQRQEALLKKGFVAQQTVDDAREAYEQARAQVESARASLELVREGPRQEEIRQAQARVEQARAALRQAEAHKVDVDLARDQADAAKAAVEQAEASLATAKANLRQVTAREEDVKASREALRQAEASLQLARTGHLQVGAQQKEVEAAIGSLRQAQASLDDIQYSFRNTSITAPRDGVVLSKPVEEGTVIPAGTSLYSQGTTIVTLADVSQMFVMAKVDESDIGQVKIGQQATIDLDVLPNRHLQGKVIKIYPEAVTEQDVVSYNVRVRLLEVPPEARPGMTASVVISIARLDNVLIVPDAAIDRSNRKTEVEVMQDGEPVKREIKVGLTNWTDTQVLEGLKEGDEVVIPGALAQEQERPNDRSRTARRGVRMMTPGGGRGR